MGQGSFEDEGRTERTVKIVKNDYIFLVENFVLGDRCLKVKEIGQ